MAMVTRSQKRARVYARKFDHDEALALHAQGWTVSAIARKHGVSWNAVKRVVDPEVRAQMDKESVDRKRRCRRPCLGGCGTLVWMHNKRASGFCSSCVVTFGSVAPDELLCTVCNKWKPDDEFREHGSKSRRYRKARCLDCERAYDRARGTEKRRTP